MNRVWLKWMAGLLSVVWAQAQVQVVLELEQDQVLPGESLRVAARTINHSGQTLSLGRDNEWLQFMVERPDGIPVSCRGTVPVEEAFELPTSKMATKRVDLTPFYDFEEPGRYLVTATVRIAGWGREFRSKPMTFHVVRGSTLWQQEVGVPVPGGEVRDPEVRRFILQQALHVKVLKLYARVTDATGSHIYGTTPLGLMLSISDPEKAIDEQTRLHVLWQTGARGFTYCIVDLNGRLVRRETYDIADHRPALRRDKEGKLVVVGGVRRPAADDL
ncbi:MAG: hypothetical protein KJ072_01800 [Verrucomicrobia bacterium]|nr:hypothetical protein [Verrucomicrobiota bacterium]